MSLTSIETVEANGHLPEILDRVARGETITLTDHGRPVAQVVPPLRPRPTREGLASAGRKMLEWRDKHGPTLGDMTIREAIEEGRRPISPGPSRDPQTRDEINRVAREMLAYRAEQKRTLGDLTAREMIEEGRRF